MSLRNSIQGMAHQLADARHIFEEATFWNRRRARDKLLAETACGVQNCLRALAMLHPAGPAPGLKRVVAMHKENTASVGRNAERQDAEERLGPKDEHAMPERQTPQGESA